MHSAPNLCHLQEYLSEALQEERERSEANVQRAVEATREQVQTKMEDLAKVSTLLCLATN